MKTVLGQFQIQADQAVPAAALEAAGMLMRVDDEAFHSYQKEGAEFAALPVHGPKIVFLNEQPEKFLRQVFGIVRIVYGLADVGVKGIPVKPAKMFERFA